VVVWRSRLVLQGWPNQLDTLGPRGQPDLRETHELLAVHCGRNYRLLPTSVGDLKSF
jgi:hypothetical protein